MRLDNVGLHTEEMLVLRPLFLLLMGSLMALLIGCDRPFVDPNVPEIEIVEPENTNRIFFDSSVIIKVTATSFRTVDFLEVNDKQVQFDEIDGLWVDTLELQPGVNSILIKAVDVEGVEGEQELVLPFLRPSYEDSAPRLPAPRRLEDTQLRCLQMEVCL